ncbi:MAG: hypothetical protein MJ209_01815 [archaeon]|nr:hypothetical protein [archaeon]
MNLEKTINNVKSLCESYVEPESAIVHINKDYFIMKEPSDYIFINCGLFIPAPFFNEVDVYSVDKDIVSLTEEEFLKYGGLGEKYFGILVKEEAYTFGYIDLCDCKIDSGFTELKESNNPLYNKIVEIATKFMC